MFPDQDCSAFSFGRNAYLPLRRESGLGRLAFQEDLYWWGLWPFNHHKRSFKQLSSSSAIYLLHIDGDAFLSFWTPQHKMTSTNHLDLALHIYQSVPGHRRVDHALMQLLSENMLLYLLKCSPSFFPTWCGWNFACSWCPCKLQLGAWFLYQHRTIVGPELQIWRRLIST